MLDFLVRLLGFGPVVFLTAFRQENVNMTFAFPTRTADSLEL
jgi:hypothetical protein